jgi:glycosyltransferase involved in cell wall biosynthesis
MVIYASNGGLRPVDAWFEAPVAWDVDLLSGHDHCFLRRATRNPIDGRLLSLRDVDVVAALRAYRPDVFWVFGYSHLTHLLAVISQRLAGVPILLRHDQRRLHRLPWWKALIKRPLLTTLFHNERGLYVGTENQKWFDHYGFLRSRQFYTPCSCDESFHSEYCRLVGQKADLRAEFGIRVEAGPVVVTASRLIDEKQPLALLESFRRVRARTRCCLLVVGTGHLQQAMREAIDSQAIPDVVFAGFLNQTQIARAYVAGDVFALMSQVHETWGVVVNEAMTCRLPVVLSDEVGAAADLGREGVNGFVVRADDPCLMSERLYDLVSDSGKREAFGNESGRVVRAHTYTKAAQGVLSATADAVGPARWAIASLNMFAT